MKKGLPITKKSADKSTENQRGAHLKKYQWPKGVSGNPAGRPKGKLSPIDRIRQMFEENEKDFDEFLTEYLNDPSNKKHIVEMLDGRPMQRIDHSTMGKELPQPILNVFPNNSNEQNNGDEEEDTSSSGGDVSQ